MASIRTAVLSGTETAIPVGGTHCAVRNDSTGVIYASAQPGITAGSDGVMSVPAGGSAVVPDTRGTVYLLGTGSVQLCGSDYIDNPFKTVSGGSGGDAADEVARTAISTHAGNAEVHVTAADKAAWNSKAELSDIPTSLPANGGNADTVGGKSSDEFIYARGYITGANLNEVKYPCSGLAISVINAPFNDNAWGTFLCYAGGTGSWVQICTANNSTITYIRHFDGNVWSDWKNIADGGNADTLDGKHASAFSGENLLINPDFSINQRGKEIYSGGDCVDRWILSYAGASCSLSADGTLKSEAAGAVGKYAALAQFIEKPERLSGMSVTFTVEIESTPNPWNIQLWKTGTTGTTTSIATSNTLDKQNAGSRLSITAVLPQIAEGEKLRVVIQTRTEIKLKWAKFEIGSTATDFVPPEIGLEIFKCQRFYQLRSTNSIAEIDLRPQMVKIKNIVEVEGGYAYVGEV